MKESEVSDLLTLCGTFDGRETSLSAVMAWHPLLEPCDFNDACDAVRNHYSRTRERIMPVDIIDGVRRTRALRLAKVEEPPPDADPADPKAYLQALRAGRRAIADGEREDLRSHPIMALIESNPIGVITPVDYNGPQVTHRRKQSAMLAIEASKAAREEQERQEREARRAELERREAARQELEEVRKAKATSQEPADA